MTKPRLESPQQVQWTQEALAELREKIARVEAGRSPLREASLKGMREFEAKLVRDLEEYHSAHPTENRKQAI